MVYFSRVNLETNEIFSKIMKIFSILLIYRGKIIYMNCKIEMNASRKIIFIHLKMAKVHIIYRRNLVIFILIIFIVQLSIIFLFFSFLLGAYDSLLLMHSIKTHSSLYHSLCLYLLSWIEKAQISEKDIFFVINDHKLSYVSMYHY